MLAAAAARLRWAGVLAAADARAARAVFAASPRAPAVLEDAAREAAVRFEALVSVVSLAASADAAVAAFFSAADLAAVVFAAVDFAVVVFAAVDLAVVVFAAVDFAAAVSAAAALAAADGTAELLGAVVFDAVVFGVAVLGVAVLGVRGFAAPAEPDAVDLVVPDFAAAGLVARFGAAGSVDAPAELVEEVGVARGGRFAGVRDARGAVDDPPSADTPVPVPSGASSS